MGEGPFEKRLCLRTAALRRGSQENGQPSIIGYYADGQPQSVATFDGAERRIQAIRLVVNPEKLRTVPSLEQVEGKENPE